MKVVDLDLYKTLMEIYTERFKNGNTEEVIKPKKTKLYIPQEEVSRTASESMGDSPCDYDLLFTQAVNRVKNNK